MVRHTKPLSGGAKDKFLRGLVDVVDAVPAGARAALSRELTEAIAEVRVRRDAYERVRDQPARAATVLEAATIAAPTPAPAKTEPATPTFDPFAFSVVAVLTKRGNAALLAELEKIVSLEDLRRIADAQHLALDPDMKLVAEVRAAIVTGAERRIAERKAAAS